MTTPVIRSFTHMYGNRAKEEREKRERVNEDVSRECLKRKRAEKRRVKSREGGRTVGDRRERTQK